MDVRTRFATLLCCALTCGTSSAYAQISTDPAPLRQSTDETWWTGPMLANSAATLPRGHFLIEPYLYGVSSSHSDSFGSLTYILYGITDRFTAGLTPVFGYTRVAGGPDSSGIGAGDLSVLMQYRLTQFPVESSLPTVSLQLQETLPTGEYDSRKREKGQLWRLRDISPTLLR